MQIARQNKRARESTLASSMHQPVAFISGAEAGDSFTTAVTSPQHRAPELPETGAACGPSSLPAHQRWPLKIRHSCDPRAESVLALNGDKEISRLPELDAIADTVDGEIHPFSENPMRQRVRTLTYARSGRNLILIARTRSLSMSRRDV
jgi:hypothetical protein